MFRDDVETFILSHLHSIEQLEVLLLLKSEPARAWSADQLSKRLCTHRDAASQRLSELEQAGVVRRTETPVNSFQYFPDSPELADTLAQLERDYKYRRASVISFIYSGSRSSAHEFSRAFKISKKKE